MRELKKLDTVAYIRFASVHRDFKDVNEFKAELEGLLGGHSHTAHAVQDTKARSSKNTPPQTRSKPAEKKRL